MKKNICANKIKSTCNYHKRRIKFSLYLEERNDLLLFYYCFAKNILLSFARQESSISSLLSLENV